MCYISNIIVVVVVVVVIIIICLNNVKKATVEMEIT